MIGKVAEKDKSLRDLIYFPVIFNMVGLVVFALLFAVSPETSIGSEIFNTVVYLYLFILEWLLASVVIRRLKRQGVAIKEFIVPKKRFRLLPAILVFVSLNVLFSVYMIVSLASGYIPPMRNLSLPQVVFLLR